MTRMIPDTIHSSVRSGAERKIFRLLQTAPKTDGWVCLHSLSLARHDHKRRAEIDFLLITPEGIFVLEVKGGRVQREAGTWVFTDRWGRRHKKTEGPFDQASSAMFALERDLRTKFEEPRLRNILLGFGVMFPDVRYDAVGTEADRRQVFDISDLDRPITRFATRLTEFTRERQAGRRNGLRKEEVAQVVEFLRGDFDLLPSFRVLADDVNQELLRLTKEQYACLECLDQEERVLVEGPAGTGKSLLALECARREARRGNRVLLLCYSELLASRLAAGIAESELQRLVTVRHLQGFLSELFAAGGLSADLNEARLGKDELTLLTEVYPHFAELALANDALEQFEVVVVDEAQDVLSKSFIDVIGGALAGGMSAGRWRIFLDSNNQASVFAAFDPAVRAELARFGQTSVLTANCRNTKSIETATRAFAAHTRRAWARATGASVERRWYSTDKQLKARLTEVLAELGADGVSPGATSILFPAPPPSAIEKHLADYNAVELDAVHAPLLGSETLDLSTWGTVAAYKGLENDVVVLAGVDDVEAAKARSIVYVGMSRARVQLYVIVHEKLKGVIDDRFAALLEEQLGGGFGE